VDTILTLLSPSGKVGRPDAHVEKALGVSRSQIYDWIDQDKFVKQVKLSYKMIGFPIAEVEAWLDARLAERDKKEAVQLVPAVLPELALATQS
jgi:predicted DNA-binding transcriptional regulator AlpA